MAKKVFAALGKAACYTLLFIGMQLIVSMVFALIGGVGAVVPFLNDNSMIDMEAVMQAMTEYLYDKALLIALISDCIALLFLLVFFKARKKNFAAQIHLKKGLPRYAIFPLLIGGVCLAGFVGLLLNMLPIPESVWEEYNSEAAMLGNTGMLAIIASVIIAPVSEEIFFRGLVYTRLRKAMPSAVAMVLSSLVFGLLHGQLIWICYAFFVGIAMAIVFERTGTVRATIAVHLAFNLAGGYVLGGIEAGPVLAFAFAAGTVACWIWLCRICPYTKLRPEDL
jgi:membrane protease YdiL (CAAX protease family)